MGNKIWVALLSVGLVTPLAAQLSRWSDAINAGEQARQAGNFAKAEQAYAEALQAVEADGALTVERAIAMVKRAGIQHDLQRTRDAERGYLQARTLLQTQPESARVKNGLATLTINLAALYIETDQPSKAKKLNLEQIIPDLNDPIKVATARSNLASIAFRQREFDKAEAEWMRSLSVFESAQRHEDAAVVLSNLGLLAAERGHVATAATRLEQSVVHLEAIDRLEDVLALKHQANLGHVLFRLGRYEEAARWLQRAYDLGAHWLGEQHPVTVQVGVSYAGVLRKTGRKKEAKLIRERAAASVAAFQPSERRATVDVLELTASPHK